MAKGKVAKGKGSDLSYILLSPYFILNFSSLLIYPVARFFLGLE